MLLSARSGASHGPYGREPGRSNISRAPRCVLNEPPSFESNSRRKSWRVTVNISIHDKRGGRFVRCLKISCVATLRTDYITSIHTCTVHTIGSFIFWRDSPKASTFVTLQVHKNGSTIRWNVRPCRRENSKLIAIHYYEAQMAEIEADYT